MDRADQAGFSVSGGFDVNGDSVSDFIIGAPDGGTIGDFDGKAYIVFGQVLLSQLRGKNPPHPNVMLLHVPTPSRANMTTIFVSTGRRALANLVRLCLTRN